MTIADPNALSMPQWQSEALASLAEQLDAEARPPRLAGAPEARRALTLTAGVLRLVAAGQQASSCYRERELLAICSRAASARLELLDRGEISAARGLELAMPTLRSAVRSAQRTGGPR